MAKSDIVPEAGAAIAAAPITDIHVIGRRGPEHASFTNNELAEMGRLARAVAVTEPGGARRGSRRRRIRRPSGCARPRTSRSCAASPRTSPAASRSRCISVFNRAGGFEPARSSSRPASCRRPGHHLHRLPRRGLPQGRGRFPGRLGQARARPAPSRPTAPTATPWRKQVDGLAEGARSQERARPAADRRRRRGLAPHRQGTRSRPAPSPGPASREIDRLAGAAGHRAGG